jgi:prolipoprotein diacylglyceryltransferase
LFFVLRAAYNSPKKDKQGYMIGLFFTGMFSIRFLIEFIKESQGGFEELMPLFSTGQWLSIPLVILGLFLVFRQNKVASS